MIRNDRCRAKPTDWGARAWLEWLSQTQYMAWYASKVAPKSHQAAPDRPFDLASQEQELQKAGQWQDVYSQGESPAVVSAS